MLQLLHIMDDEEWTSALEKGGQINTIYAILKRPLIRYHITYYLKNCTVIILT